MSHPGLLQDAVWEALATVIDPELGVAVTDLGLVYNVEAHGDAVHVDLATTTPVCPLGEYLARTSEARIAALPGVGSVEVSITNDPPWTPQRMTDAARRALGWDSRPPP